MATISLTNSYSGRTVDLCMFQLSSPDYQGRVTLSFSNNPKICAGIEKIAQMFTVTLFTQLGSVLADPTFGVDALGPIGETNVIGDHIQQVVQLAVFDSYAILRDDQNAIILAGKTIPADEQLTEAKLIDVQAAGDRVTISVQLTTLAGTSRVFIIPAPAATAIKG